METEMTALNTAGPDQRLLRCCMP